MIFLRWLSLLATVSALVSVVAGNVRGFRSGDPAVLRRSARRLGWGVAGAFVLAAVVYSIAAVASFGMVAAAKPGDKVAVMAAGLEEPASYFRWPIGILVVALLGLVVMRFRAGYLTTEE